jgi:hypothetical protein
MNTSLLKNPESLKHISRRSPLHNHKKKRNMRKPNVRQGSMQECVMKSLKNGSFSYCKCTQPVIGSFCVIGCNDFIIGIPVVLAYIYEFTGIIMGCLFLLAIGRPVFNYAKHFFQPAELWTGVMGLVETYFFRYTLLTVTNVYILLRVGLQTLLPLYITVAVLIVPSIACYYWLFRKKEKTERLFVSICLVPLVINFVFLLNFFASSNPTIEQYEIWDEISHTKSGSRQSTLIHLEHGRYENYVGIRIFSDITPDAEQRAYRLPV